MLCLVFSCKVADIPTAQVGQLPENFRDVSTEEGPQTNVALGGGWM